MENLKTILNKDYFSLEFRHEGYDWILSTEWGDASVNRKGSSIIYFLNKENSSIFNLTLAGLALKKENDQILYSFVEVLDEKCILQIKTPMEVLTYVFIITPYRILKRMRKEMVKANLYLDTIKAPITGVVVPKLLNEYGKLDSLMLLDYSHLNLEFPPTIFPFILGREGYVSLNSKTKSNCVVYVHLNKADPIDPQNNEWKLGYLIMPKEPEKPTSQIRKFDLARFREGIKEGRGFALFEDKIIDVKLFFERHIGGPYVLNNLVGREIGRYIYGSFPKKGVTHQHSAKAEQLVEKYQIGFFEDPLPKEMFIGIAPDKELKDYVFTLTKINRVNDFTNMITFKPDNLQVKQIFNETYNFGKYFVLTSLSKKVSRNYYYCSLFDKTILELHQNLAEAIKNEEPTSPVYTEYTDVKRDTISLMVKSKGVFSSWLNSSDSLNENFTFKGPLVNIILLTYDYRVWD